MTPEIKSEYTSILERLNALESEIKDTTRRHLAQSQREKWTRETEAITDQLVQLGAWVYDVIHGNEASPDPLNEKYLKSMLRRIRKALKYSY